MEQIRKVKLRDGRVVTVTGPIRRIPPAGVEYDSLILPRDYRGGNHCGATPDPEDDPPNTNAEVADRDTTEEVYRRAELGVLYDALNTALTKRENLIVRRNIEGYTFREIAGELCWHEDRVESTYRRAIEKIQRIAGTYNGKEKE